MAMDPPYSFPDSLDSSPRSRDIDTDSTTATTFDEPPPTHKVKFMCSYGGRIQPRPHNNHLTYVGGETKILAVDRNIKFSTIMSKLSSLSNTTTNNICFKYQLPGEDLDALISVTNDEDLHHMMAEYDRLCRASPRPARLRLILFPLNTNTTTTTNTNTNTNNNNSIVPSVTNFVDALNSVTPPPPVAPDNPDFLFGLDKPDPADSVTVPDFAAKDAECFAERQIQEFQKLQLGNNNSNQEKPVHSVNSGPVRVPGPVPVQAPFFPVSGNEPAPVYLIQTPGGVYQAVRAPVYLIQTPATVNKVRYGGSQVAYAAAPGGDGWN